MAITSGSCLEVGTPEQTPLSQPPASPYSPHPFWSEKAKAEMELAHARPPTLDEEAKRVGSGVARRPLDLETRARGSTEVRVDEEVKEPTYDLRDGGAEGVPGLTKAILDVNRDTDKGRALGPRESTMLTLPEVGLGRSLVRSPSDCQGAIAYPTEGNAHKILETAHEQVSAAAVQLSPKPAVQLSPKPAVQLSPRPGVQRSLQPSAPTSPRPGVQASPDTRFRVEGSASEDQLLEITKLRSLVEHLSDRLERFEEAKSFGSASSGRVRSSDLEATAQVLEELTRPLSIPPLPCSSLQPDFRQFSFDESSGLPGFGFRQPAHALWHDSGHRSPLDSARLLFRL